MHKVRIEGDTGPLKAHKPRLKKCAKCGLKKELDMFGKNETSSDGHQSYCKKCKNALGKRRRERNVSARVKHHISTRVQLQLGMFCPENVTLNLERYLGYPIPRLTNALSADLRQREGRSLREALQEGYHVDHVRPLSSFKVIRNGEVDWDTFKECWAISNLRAISAEENLAKGAKRNVA